MFKSHVVCPPRLKDKADNNYRDQKRLGVVIFILIYFITTYVISLGRGKEQMTFYKQYIYIIYYFLINYIVCI